MQGMREVLAQRAVKAISVVAACVAGLIMAIPAPALAAVGTSSQWKYFPELGLNRYPGSNLVKFWQVIVWSDVSTGNSCPAFVDGQFGSNTSTRTKSWQSTFKIKADGGVGTQTWTTAQTHLSIDRTDVIDNRNASGTGYTLTSIYYWYAGKQARFYLSWGYKTYYAGGQAQYTTDEPWEFQPCAGGWTPVTW